MSDNDKVATWPDVLPPIYLVQRHTTYNPLEPLYQGVVDEVRRAGVLTIQIRPMRVPILNR